MRKTICYSTEGTCSRSIRLTMNDDVIENVEFAGGYPGNLRGISSLVCGMKAREVIARLKGIRCGDKATSCPDQLCRAIEAVLQGDY
ncbi:MAG TPA: TIGR03905 family TSCPD domain-containing protein [Alloprevotella sp.]|nr:TIGR03905 family TSCPD domain-containing protein [Alloprevotella sp.]